ncbi:beta and beta-prime subunits of DNA dependent RNA-polymerase [Sistotremastrum niveocremeum HHB9708]|uniref:DNA-directed RNA polymerase n=1 Tax=Sistotremastrum niveocremeum HHB9708 TaxID=1314777 RepID=A0A164WTP1_9AGAM|nr:beta and beta-prime subunits of DNA dependent RNA-polymerase [Sistotremastrum niveocremeum HHB9708]
MLMLCLDICLANGAEIYAPSTFVVNVTGSIIGLTWFPTRFLANFRRLRRARRFSEFVSVYVNHHYQALHIASDGGRICGPMSIVKNEKSRVTSDHVIMLKTGEYVFDDFLSMGLVEYLDANEENDALMALYESNIVPGTTHLEIEIEPLTILGVVAGLIPYPHHNQSPRNTYQCAMHIWVNRQLGLSHITSSIPMVKTETIELIGWDKFPAGQNATVAASLDRAYGRCQVLRKFSTIIRKYPNGTFDRLADALVDEHGNAEGLAGLVEQVYPGDIYINKQTPKNAADNSLTGQGAAPYKTTHLTYKFPIPGYIDKMMITGAWDALLIKALIRRTYTGRRVFAVSLSTKKTYPSTIGELLQLNTWFDSACTVLILWPDTIMNPHGFPSRMMVRKMIEFLAGKAGVLSGKLQYGTAFAGSKVEDMSRILIIIENDFSYSGKPGKDMLANGLTGEPLEA